MIDIAAGWYIYWLRSFLEVLSIYCFSSLLGGEGRMKVRALFLGSLGVSLVIIVLDYFDASFIPLVALFLCVVGLKLSTTAKLSELVGNLVFGTAATFLLELIATGVLLIPGKDYGMDGISCIMSGLLAIAVICNLILHRDNRIARKANTILRDKSNYILIVSISIIVPIVMLSNIFLDNSMMFWEGYYETSFLAALYFVMNLFLIKYFVDISHKENEIKIIREYGEHLKELAEELNKREHEYKNQLNTIIGTAERGGPECRKQIIEYAESITRANKNRRTGGSIISDNSVIAAYILKMSRIAEARDIRFDYYIARPFPVYDLPESELSELLANLINNAFEAAEELDGHKRYAAVCLEEDYIEVSNYVNKDFSKSMIKKANRPGFSTKGRNRGYGMVNIRDIVKRHGFKMESYLRDDLLTFTIRMK
ncbi:GHKL domain-containing protein [Anaerovorax odorimutans]|uniref:GHKL domain-containing protein n=1 Tax=Anaerovorax odorimutans TaxID=109327 RepID=A0ABT1RQ71_9FIRM|nr:GHKL domain-containing protein [Anaerovorax odorimutans]MCQ4637314.1 GHKL domain-containing protein [Anaerovorax odorimutans]